MCVDSQSFTDMYLMGASRKCKVNEISASSIHYECDIITLDTSPFPKFSSAHFSFYLY